MMQKAAAMPVDHVFLDLEDAVAPSEKQAARTKIINAMNTLDWGRKTRCVRVNDVTSPWALDDMMAVVMGCGENVDTIMLPKIRSAADVTFFDLLLGQLEQKLSRRTPIGLEILIEEVEGMFNLDEIVRSTPRLEAIIFGMGDYSASQNMDPLSLTGKSDYPADIWHYARNRIVISARANGIDVVDGPFANLADHGLYETECRRALALGCVGKWALHPAQAEIAMRCFSPVKADVERARRLEAAYHAAVAAGEGALQFEGEMVDAASVRIARRAIEFDERIQVALRQ
jgi:citrate lyase subunit beta/citryl-CoA lyase